MKQIITPAQVVEIAFTDGEYIAAESIAEADIAAATERWILPVAGSEVLEAVAEERYGDFAEEYLKPAIALYTRCLVQPRLNVSTSMLGLSSPASANRKAADKEHTLALMASLRKRARTALRSMSDYLQANAADMAEYDPKSNILNRCTTDGGFVQIF